MPGTIQVSILELVGLPSVSQSSSMGIKVTVGKQESEVQGGGDLSPLGSLRDNLNVSVHDAKGNEIAQTAVETRSIVEQGIWEDLFALKGGGHIRMRLQFKLTEVELNRIRSMRESATKKKQEDLLKRSHSSSELTTASSGGSPSSSQDSLKTNRRVEKKYITDAKILSKDHLSPKRQATPTFPASKSTGALDKLQANRQIIQSQDQQKQTSLEKTPSNVRKMALAFETKPVKEMSPAIYKTSSLPQISGTTMVDVPARLPSVMKTIGANAKPAPIPEGAEKGRGENHNYVQSKFQKEEKKDLEVQNIGYISTKKDIPTLQPIREEQKEDEKDLKLQNIDCMSKERDIAEKRCIREEQRERESPEKYAQSSTAESSRFSWGGLARAFPSRKQSPTDISTGQQGSPLSDPFVIDNKWKSKHWMSLQKRVKSNATCESVKYVSDRFHDWIFIDEMISSCIPSDDWPFIDLLEGCPSKCSSETSRGKISDTGFAPDSEQNISELSQKPDSGSNANNGEPKRPFGQAMKIAIMVGFGLLVFLTRQSR